MPSYAPPKRGVRRRRRAGDLEALRRELWHCILTLTDKLDETTDTGEIVKIANAVGTCANAYRGITELADLVPRLEALEAAQVKA